MVQQDVVLLDIVENIGVFVDCFGQVGNECGKFYVWMVDLVWYLYQVDEVDWIMNVEKVVWFEGKLGQQEFGYVW